MRDIRGGTQVLFLYRVKRESQGGTVNIVFYVGTDVRQVKNAAYELNDDHVLSVETLRPVQVILSNVQ